MKPVKNSQLATTKHVNSSPRYLKIKDWAEDDRPREKLKNKGKENLSDAELLAILLRTGTSAQSAVDVAKNLLKHAENNLNTLARMNFNEIKKVKGVGEVKAITIVSALELGRRRNEEVPIQRPKIGSSRDVFYVMSPLLMDLPHEEFWVLLLNRANIVIKKERISRGGLSGTVADPKLIFKKALDSMAASLIMVHNHPSGNVKPSDADIRLTYKLRDAGKFLDLPVLDHLIFANEKYYSFADEGRLH